MTKPRILIMTVPHGASHQRVATALQKALLEIKPSLAVKVINALHHCPCWFRQYYNSYQLPLKYFPPLWGWIEQFQHDTGSTGPAWLYRRAGQPLFRFIQAYQPDVVVATEVGMCELAAMLKREIKLRFRLVGVVTGIDVDRAWSQPEVDLYPIAPGDTSAQLEARGVPRAKILPCGQPVDPAFVALPDRQKVREDLKISSELPLLLVLFGGTGVGKPRQMILELKKVKHPVQVVFITGRNGPLKEEVESLSNGHQGYRVLGWVDNMQEWMAAADLLVSKPGASTMMESINCGLPLLALDPLPGNERRACDWIERWGVGHWVKHRRDLAPTIDRLLANRGELGRLRDNARHLARPRAVYDAASAILKLNYQ